MRGTWIQRGFALLGAFVLSGCYTYIPVTAAAPGSTVRAYLPVESPAVGGRGADRITVEGTVVEHGDSLVLATETTTVVGNFREVRQQDTLRVASQRVAGLEERSFSRSRTLGFGALVTAGVMALVLGVAGAAGGGDDGGNGGGGVGASVTVGGAVGWLTSLIGGG